MTCLRVITGVSMLLVGTAVLAEDTDSVPLWELRGVGFGQNFPAYPSSSEQNLTLLPIPVPVYRGKVFRFGEDLEDIATGRIIHRERIKLSIGFNLSFPEDSDELNAREGMEDLDLLGEIGPNLLLTLAGGEEEDDELTLSLQVRGAVSADGLDPKGRGFVFNPELEYKIGDAFGTQNEIRFRVSPTWASSNYMNFFYGVDPQFATPVRPEFDASSGYLNTEFLVGVKRNISKRLQFKASARLWVNKGAANDSSPLYRRDYNRGVRAAFVWTLAESKRRKGAK